MKVLYLHQYFRTPGEGGGTRSYAMAQVLRGEGHSIVMVTSDQRAISWRIRRTQIDGIDVRYVPARYDNGMAAPRRILAFLLFAFRSTLVALTMRADVVLATSTPLTIAIPGILASRWRRVPFVFEVRDMWPDVPIAMGMLRNPVLRWLAYRLEAFAYKAASRIVALAPGMKNEVVAKGIPAEKVVVIPNGCDNDIFYNRPDGAIISDINPRYLVVFAGTLGAANGVHYLAELAAAMRMLSAEVGFVVMGDGAQRRKISESAARVGILNSNFYMLGSVSKSDVACWLRRASMSVCLFDGPEVLYRNAVQNKFFDSLAAGVPVACNFDGWQSRLALDAGIGVLLPPDDPSQGARILLDRLEDIEWLANAGVACRELASGPFDRVLLGRQLAWLLEQAVAERNAKPGRMKTVKS